MIFQCKQQGRPKRKPIKIAVVQKTKQEPTNWQYTIALGPALKLNDCDIVFCFKHKSQISPEEVENLNILIPSCEMFP